MPGILKGFVDGVIEARTAVAAGARTRATTGDGPPRPGTPDKLDAFVAEADRRGWQVELHAIGDRGVRLALDAFERAAARQRPVDRRPARAGRRARDPRTAPPRRAHRDDRRRGRAPVRRGSASSPRCSRSTATRRPNQIALWAANIGDRAGEPAWSWRSIHAAAGGSRSGRTGRSCPYDPFVALHNAVNRQTARGGPAGGWLPGERLPLPDALEAYTAGSRVRRVRGSSPWPGRARAGRGPRRARSRPARGRSICDHRHRRPADRPRRPGRPPLGGTGLKGFLPTLVASGDRVRAALLFLLPDR